MRRARFARLYEFLGRKFHSIALTPLRSSMQKMHARLGRDVRKIRELVGKFADQPLMISSTVSAATNNRRALDARRNAVVPVRAANAVAGLLLPVRLPVRATVAVRPGIASYLLDARSGNSSPDGRAMTCPLYAGAPETSM
jgi:hypothetical protein